MRLDFNVLWVDDQPERVNSQIKSIQRQMATEGFDFKPTQCITLDQVKKAISVDVFTDEVDLILVDWDLGNHVHGEDAIELIRQIVQYKDVVFYSGEATVEELREKVFQRGLEGIYCASRAELIDEVIGVFESLIKKVLDIDHTRGIVMGATSDIDFMINTCLNLAHDKLDEVRRGDFIVEVLRRVTEQVDNIKRQGDKLKAAPRLDALFNSHMLFTSDHRLRLLASILKMKEFEALAGRAGAVNEYREGVVSKRNILGHAVLVPEGKPLRVVDDAGKEVEIGEMRELRKQILRLRAEFRGLLDAMRE